MEQITGRYKYYTESENIVEREKSSSSCRLHLLYYPLDESGRVFSTSCEVGIPNFPTRKALSRLQEAAKRENTGSKSHFVNRELPLKRAGSSVLI